ncbi:MAG: AEC family transporter [Pseudanabaena sp. ELA607]
MQQSLTLLYATLIIWFSGGLIIGKFIGIRTTKSISRYLENFLYWGGIPLLTISALQGKSINIGLCLNPILAWSAIGLSLVFALIWIDLGINNERIKSDATGIYYINNLDDKTILRAERKNPGKSLKFSQSNWSQASQGSIFAAMMVGNSSYLGLIVVLSLVGGDYIGGAILYDLLGSTLACYGLGVVLARRFSNFKLRKNLLKHISLGLIRHPFLWALVLGLGLSPFNLPSAVTHILAMTSAPIICLCLIMIGLQLSQLTEIQKIYQAVIGLGIKMLVSPILIGVALTLVGITGPLRLAIVLQCAMPPSLITLSLAQEYRLDQELAATFFAGGCFVIFATLPLWVWLFGG